MPVSLYVLFSVVPGTEVIMKTLFGLGLFLVFYKWNLASIVLSWQNINSGYSVFRYSSVLVPRQYSIRSFPRLGPKAQQSLFPPYKALRRKKALHARHLGRQARCKTPNRQSAHSTLVSANTKLTEALLRAFQQILLTEHFSPEVETFFEWKYTFIIGQCWIEDNFSRSNTNSLLRKLEWMVLIYN